MTAVITIVRRRPGVAVSSARSFFAYGCMSMARPTSIRWPDEKVNGGAPSSFRKASVAARISASVISDLRRRSPTLGICLPSPIVLFQPQLGSRAEARGRSVHHRSAEVPDPPRIEVVIGGSDGPAQRDQSFGGLLYDENTADGGGLTGGMDDDCKVLRPLQNLTTP